MKRLRFRRASVSDPIVALDIPAEAVLEVARVAGGGRVGPYTGLTLVGVGLAWTFIQKAKEREA